MTQLSPSLTQLATYLDALLQTKQFVDDQHGIYQSSDRLVKKLGLALEPFEGMDQWIKDQALDALFLHRPWQLQPSEVTATLGILAYHLAFDERLTTGFNPFLAEDLRLTQVEPFGDKEGRPLGMVGTVERQPFEKFRENVSQVFEGEEAYLEGTIASVTRVAVVGAMTKKLIKEASALPIDVYLTGQVRKHAIETVYREPMHIIAIGHQRSELWGLKKLAALLQTHWSKMDLVLAPCPLAINNQ